MSGTPVMLTLTDGQARRLRDLLTYLTVDGSDDELLDRDDLVLSGILGLVESGLAPSFDATAEVFTLPHARSGAIDDASIQAHEEPSPSSTGATAAATGNAAAALTDTDLDRLEDDAQARHMEGAACDASPWEVVCLVRMVRSMRSRHRVDVAALCDEVAHLRERLDALRVQADADGILLRSPTGRVVARAVLRQHFSGITEAHAERVVSALGFTGGGTR